MFSWKKQTTWIICCYRTPWNKISDSMFEPSLNNSIQWQNRQYTNWLNDRNLFLFEKYLTADTLHIILVYIYICIKYTLNKFKDLIHYCGWKEAVYEQGYILLVVCSVKALRENSWTRDQEMQHHQQVCVCVFVCEDAGKNHLLNIIIQTPFTKRIQSVLLNNLVKKHLLKPIDSYFKNKNQVCFF